MARVKIVNLCVMKQNGGGGEQKHPKNIVGF
jgi:hypothetical protein